MKLKRFFNLGISLILLSFTACNGNLSSYCSDHKYGGGFNTYEGYITIDTEKSVKALDFTSIITKDKNSNSFKLSMQGSKGPNGLNIDIKKDIIEFSKVQVNFKSDFDPNLVKEVKCSFDYDSQKASGKDAEKISDKNATLTIKSFNYINEHDYKISGSFSGKDEATGKAFSGQFETGTNQLATACLY